MQRYIVHVKGWTNERFHPICSPVAQAAPGPDVLFTSLIGYRVAGIAGSPNSLLGYARQRQCSPGASQSSGSDIARASVRGIYSRYHFATAPGQTRRNEDGDGLLLISMGRAFRSRPVCSGGSGFAQPSWQWAAKRRGKAGALLDLAARAAPGRARPRRASRRTTTAARSSARRRRGCNLATNSCWSDGRRPRRPR
jgi:hypothetical protein